MKITNQIIFENRQEMVKEIVAREFEGLCVDRPTNPLFRKILAIGALSRWQMYGFEEGVLIKDQCLDQKDAQSIYWAFRDTGFLKVLDALAYSEHSWGWTFHDLDLLEGLISLVQSKLQALSADSEDSNAWGALNLFKTFVSSVDSVNVLVSNVPCVCYHCIKKNFWLFLKNRKSILQTRRDIEKYLILNVTESDIQSTYDPN